MTVAFLPAHAQVPFWLLRMRHPFTVPSNGVTLRPPAGRAIHVHSFDEALRRAPQPVLPSQLHSRKTNLAELEPDFLVLSVVDLFTSGGNTT